MKDSPTHARAQTNFETLGGARNAILRRAKFARTMSAEPDLTGNRAAAERRNSTFSRFVGLRNILEKRKREKEKPNKEGEKN